MLQYYVNFLTGVNMNKISISEAARMAEISRTHLYKNYINKGKISVIRDDDKVYIDVSELIRVFPNCKLSDNAMGTELSDVDTTKTQVDSELISILKAQLTEAREREEWLKQQIDELRQQQNNLLENKLGDSNKTRKKFLGIF